ncbi:chromosome partitioning protein ParA [Bacillus sp. L381]|uniref:chromosome partitioning protein ParA n=1 Tax=Bacillus TaxID=1386 RepID=UPI001BAC3088|nr:MULTISPECIES: chromosome partitioning protein ParA [Bacillus]MCR9040898.1 chromosome partitioning protein ParA [Bacillus velezensis]QUN08015.1 chromosome partitioning protein ParA [Bacillus amyloliquefaciens]QYM81081.1 chromosome partitioning protein ParA [Bacillus sp. 7D3]QZY10230.1 chromosome partitioning protein ParA [Bacillus amyloliquefaciens]QZY11140.1 chromosome partitioning protein ParA [Bacillus amyloliquefaciens]
MYQLMKVKADVRQASNKISALIGQRDLLRKQKDEARKRLEAAEQELGNFDLVQILLQKTSEYARQQAKKQIEDIVTSALSVVFGKDYRFNINIEVKANQPVAEYWLTSEGVTTQLKPPDYDRGGGVADVVSLALKLAVGELSGVRGPLFLDEAAKHVSQEYVQNVAFFLKEFSRKFNRQMVLVTHSPTLAETGDTSISINQQNGESRVETIQEGNR